MVSSVGSTGNDFAFVVEGIGNPYEDTQLATPYKLAITRIAPTMQRFRP
jgi:hypothetical protein